MRILIAGFDSYAELDRTMQKLIEESQCFLFDVICGGTDMSHPQQSLAREWAKRNGAPIYYIYDEDMNKLLWKMEINADYLVMQVGDDTPQVWKNLMMRMKANGKHGTIVRR